MKITLLGGNGFIGSHLAARLVDSGHEVSIFHRPNASIENIGHLVQKVQIIEGDFNRPDDLGRVIKDAQVIVHLVNSTTPGSSLADPAFDIQSNVLATVRLLDACVKTGVEKLVYLSSGGTVYGIPQYTPIDEKHPSSPIAPYGISKLMVEKYLAMYHYQYGLDYTVLRLSNPYGARQDPHRGQGVLAAWMHRLMRGEPLEIWGDGSVVRDYLYIEDAVRAIELACTVPTVEKIFNVGSGVGYSLAELRHKLEELTGLTIKVNHKTMQKVDVPINVLNVDLISQALQWRPTIDIDHGLSLMWNQLDAG